MGCAWIWDGDAPAIYSVPFPAGMQDGLVGVFHDLACWVASTMEVGRWAIFTLERGMYMGMGDLACWGGCVEVARDGGMKGKL